MNDLMAAECLNAAQELRLSIPQDFSIIGFGNREIASYLTVHLTTIQLPTTEIGHRSGEMLLELIEDAHIEQNGIILPCELIERESVSRFSD
jgi:DNA-binding LacI/PurR family transcriptional regulator